MYRVVYSNNPSYSLLRSGCLNFYPSTYDTRHDTLYLVSLPFTLVYNEYSVKWLQNFSRSSLL